VDDHGSGTSTRTVAIAPQAWSEAPIGLIKKDSTITNTVTGAAWVVSVILAVLLYVVVSRKLAEAMATHANDMSQMREQLRAIAAAQTSIADDTHRVETRLRRLECIAEGLASLPHDAPSDAWESGIQTLNEAETEPELHVNQHEDKDADHARHEVNEDDSAAAAKVDG
jgi:hypothetical protein